MSANRKGPPRRRPYSPQAQERIAAAPPSALLTPEDLDADAEPVEPAAMTMAEPAAASVAEAAAESTPAPAAQNAATAFEAAESALPPDTQGFAAPQPQATAPAEAEAPQPQAEAPAEADAPQPQAEATAEAAASQPKAEAPAQASAQQPQATAPADAEAPQPAAVIWPLGAIDIWSESAAALLGLAEQVGQARSLDEIVRLQARFADARYESFARRQRAYATQMLQIAQKMAEAAGPRRAA